MKVLLIAHPHYRKGGPKEKNCHEKRMFLATEKPAGKGGLFFLCEAYKIPPRYSYMIQSSTLTKREA